MGNIKDLEPSVQSVLEIAPKQWEHFLKLEKLLNELEKKEIPEDTLLKINQEIAKVNTINSVKKENLVLLINVYKDILKFLLEDLKIVPKNYYTNMWLALGISAFGVPLGVVFGMSLDNMAFIGAGVPIGLALGVSIGKSLDNKAFEEGRSLNLEV